jgi:20S proteasome subunit beta 2
LIQQQRKSNIDTVTHSGDYSDIIGRLHRSDIDRDPFIYQRSREYDNEDDDILPSYGFNNVLNHNHQSSSSSSGGGEQWQSPLEGYSPLPSLSLGSSSLQQSFLSTEEANLSYGLSQRSHSHIIDIHASSSSSQQQQHPKLRTRTTGTTIVALIAAGDDNSTVLILAADTRATDGSTISDNRCSKLHELANNVWAAGAGTSADVEALVRRTKYKFWKLGRTYMDGCGGIGNTIVNDNSDNDMDKMDNNKNNVGNKKEEEEDTTCRIVSPSIITHDMIDNNTPPNYDDDDDDGSKLIPPPASVTAVLHFLRSQLRKSNGNLGVNLLVGGYDHITSRALLAAIHPHDSIDIVSYSALGSGGLAAMGVLESRYPTRRSRRRRRQQRKQDSTANADMSSSTSSSCLMTVTEGIQLAVDAVRAGIDNDLGSGSQVDVCVIGPGGVFYRRAVAREEELQWISNNVNDDVVDNDDVNGAPISVGGAVLKSSWNTAREEGQGSSSSGVNGFGNIPFAIQSKKVVIGGSSSSSKQGRHWLDEVMLAQNKKNNRELLK